MNKNEDDIREERDAIKKTVELLTAEHHKRLAKIDSLESKSFCPECGNMLEITDHYCDDCHERISVPMKFSPKAIKKLKAYLR